ncbi:hypothetical protein [Marinobacter sp.]|uniref:hypothetical protein n=1 Tax=Marinobacter sp. TaxID=50741 RepID=UPI00257FAF0F|nr:hypothetical protein [Marinobacter sp.]
MSMVSQPVVPDLLDLSKIPADYSQSVETDLLETSTFQEATATQTGFASFNLAQKGFLHSHSKLFVGLIPAAGTTNTFLPQNVGIASVLDRAVLKVRKSGQVINDIQDFGHFYSIQSAMVSNETMIEREQYTSGRCLAKEFRNQRFDDSAGGGNEVVVDDGNLAQGYGLSNGREYRTANLGNPLRPREAQLLLQHPFSKMDATSAATIAESPVYQIDLAELFPFLKTTQLPLYMIDQGLTIELFWSKTSLDRVCRGNGQVAGGQFLIDKTQLKFCADYITYLQDDAMNRWRDGHPVIRLPFSDYRLSKLTATDAALTGGVVRQLGMQNRLVSRAVTIISKQSDASDGDSDDSVLNKYNMYAPEAGIIDTSNGNEVGTISYNLKYKSRFEFSQSLTNKAQAFTQLTMSEGLPFVTRQDYSNEGTGYLPTIQFEGHTQATVLPGKFFMLGTRLTNGRVESDGVELHLKVDVPAGPFQVRTYLEYGREAVIEDGEFLVYNL